MKLSKTLRVITVTALITLPVIHAGAADDENNEVKYRQTVMDALGDQFGSLAMIFAGRVDRPMAELQTHAEALALTASLTAGLFPPGSQGGDALPKIWEEPDKVAAAADKNAKTAAALVEAVKTGDKVMIAKAFKAAGESCKACHESYKAEDD